MPGLGEMGQRFPISRDMKFDRAVNRFGGEIIIDRIGFMNWVAFEKGKLREIII